MTAATGRHWSPEVVHDSTGVISGLLPSLEDTQPFEPPTVEFDPAGIEYAKRLDAQIAAGRRAEQQRLTAADAELTAAPLWDRARRYVRDNWTVVRAVFVAGSVGVFVGVGACWLVTR